MLTQPLLEKLSQLGLVGFRAALEEQFSSPHYADLAFEERSDCWWTSKSLAGTTPA
jgi:hypothetical protein